MALTLEPDCTLADYRERYARIGLTTLLQDATYGLAMARAQALSARWLVIRDGNDELGIVQVMEKKALGGAIGVLTMDRGPLWLPDSGSDVRMGEFFRAFARLWPRRLGRRRRVIPEWPRSAENGRLLTLAGYRAIDADATGLPREAYETYLLGLDADPAVQRARLLPRWRAGLLRAERHEAEGRLRFDWPRPATVIADLVQRHVAHREQAGFRGMESAQLNRLLVDYAKVGSLLVGLAYDDAAGPAAGPCSALALLCHGRTATYQLAWNDSCGRALGANNALLWAGMGKLRAGGVCHLDLGGHSSLYTPGLQRYKAGMCGCALQLIGMYK